MICLWLQPEPEQYIILHVSAALPEAVSSVVCVVHPSHSANALRSPSEHAHTPPHIPANSQHGGLGTAPA